MNEAGVALVVAGGRVGEPTSEGQPLVHTMRDVLGEAQSTNDAIRMLTERKPMVSHIVMLADSQGDVAVVERAPGFAPWIRRDASTKIPLTNHFEGPSAADAANEEVKRQTSTLARRARLDELLSKMPEGATVEDAIAVLRDKQGVGNVVLPRGDRRAIDASIATHAVVIDTTAKVLWVSEGPAPRRAFRQVRCRCPAGPRLRSARRSRDDRYVGRPARSRGELGPQALIPWLGPVNPARPVNLARRRCPPRPRRMRARRPPVQTPARTPRRLARRAPA